MAKGCVNCMRILVFVINILLFVIGASILGFALYLYFDATVQSLKDQAGMKMKVDIFLFVAMGIGGLTTVISMFGLCGAYHENGCMLATYCVLLLIVAGLEVVAGVFLYLNRSDGTVPDSLAKSINASIHNANATTVPEHIVRLQNIFECCGANGTEYDTATADAVCTKDGKRFTEGCATKAGRLLNEHSLWVLITMACVAAVELLSVGFALLICCAANRDDEGYVGVSAD